MNQAYLRGVILNEPKYSHAYNREAYYKCEIEVSRFSGNTDVIKLMFKEDCLKDFIVGEEQTVVGKFHSYNRMEGGKSRLILDVYVDNVLPNDLNQNSNQIMLDGFICKDPSFRQTPLGKEISDFLLATNEDNGKSYYLPCIAWKQYAHKIKNCKVGQKLSIVGRIQSRGYSKNDEQLIAYEVSVIKLNIIRE